MYSERSPRLIGFQVAPQSSVRNAPAAEIAMYMRPAFDGSITMVCSPIPPAPGCQRLPVEWLRSPGSSCQLAPPSVERNMAASSTPANTVSGSVSEGSRCQTRLNSHGCGVPSYQWCVRGGRSKRILLPTGTHQWYDGTPHPWEFKRVWHLEPSHTDPDTVFAGVEDAAMFRSTDGGASWQELPGLRNHSTGNRWQPGAGGMGLHTIVIDPSNAGRMYIAISAAGAFRTEDCGATWKPINRGLRSEYIP